MMQKLMEINDHLVRTLAECEQLRSDQKTLQEVSFIRSQRIAELQTELRKAYAERDEAVEHAGRLQAERNTLDNQLQELIMSQPDFGVERMPKKNKPESQLVKEILSAMDQEEADDAPTEPKKPKKPKKPVKTSAGQSDLVRDVSHYTEAAEVDRPVESQPEPQPEYKPHTFAAYIVGDRIQPDALRIVWATEEWIEQSKFGIVHRMRDMQFFGDDGGCNITEYHETLTLNLKVQ